jgi:hypothetical protein
MCKDCEDDDFEETGAESAMQFMNMIPLISGMQNNYDSRKIAKVEPNSNGGIGVSTAYVDDLSCYETALLDANGVHPVERYDSKALAEVGHDKWVLFASTGDKKLVIKLGYLYVSSSKIILKAVV